MSCCRLYVDLVDLWAVSYGYKFGFFFFKQKTAYEMRISDWSSDVCSSDLRISEWRADIGDAVRAGDLLAVISEPEVDQAVLEAQAMQIGRASCRERVCQYV